jgi:hypothetical protein
MNKTRILSVLSLAAGLLATGCASNDTTAQNAFSGALSLVLANNPQYEPDVVTIVNTLNASDQAITLGSVAAQLTAAKVNPLVTNAVAPVIVSVYQKYVTGNPGGSIAKANAFVAASLDGALQLYVAEHPMALPKS